MNRNLSHNLVLIFKLVKKSDVPLIGHITPLATRLHRVHHCARDWLDGGIDRGASSRALVRADGHCRLSTIGQGEAVAHGGGWRARRSTAELNHKAMLSSARLDIGYPT